MKVEWTRVIGACVLVLGSVATPGLAQQSPETRMVELDGHALRVWDQGETGSGRPTVVFESGLGTPLEAWSPVAQELAALTRVIAYDRAGIAGSTPGAGDPTPRHVATELHTLLETIGPFPDVPVVVLKATRYEPPPQQALATFPGDFEAWFHARVERRSARQLGWVRAVTDGTFVATTRSGHYIQLDQPELVVWAVERVMASAAADRPHGR